MDDFRVLRGRAPEKPFRIFAVITSISFGHFISSLFFANTVANQFDYSRLVILYRKDADYKEQLAQLVPNAILAPIPEGELLPTLDLINGFPDPQISKELVHFAQGWFENQLNAVDFVITDDMSSNSNLSAFQNLAFLSFPAELAEQCREKLIELGLRPDTWFCTMYCREPGYKYKSGKPNFRDADPSTFFAAARYVTDELGGQVVRLGHPGMTPFPESGRIIDLSKIESSTLLQAYAVSRSRFMLSTPSGPLTFADAFDRHLVEVNAVDLWLRNPKSLVRTVDVFLQDGTVVNQQAYLEAGYDKLRLMKELKEKKVKVAQNTADQILDVVRQIIATTEPIDGWEPPATQSPGERPNVISWPPQAMGSLARFAKLSGV